MLNLGQVFFFLNSPLLLEKPRIHEQCFEFCFVDKRSVCCFSPSETLVSHPVGANQKAAAGAWAEEGALHMVCIKAQRSCEEPGSGIRTSVNSMLLIAGRQSFRDFLRAVSGPILPSRLSFPSMLKPRSREYAVLGMWNPEELRCLVSFPYGLVPCRGLSEQQTNPPPHLVRALFIYSSIHVGSHTSCEF